MRDLSKLIDIPGSIVTDTLDLPTSRLILRADAADSSKPAFVALTVVIRIAVVVPEVPPAEVICVDDKDIGCEVVAGCPVFAKPAP